MESAKKIISGFAPILVVVILGAIGIVGYFAYQNYQLKRQLSENETVATPTLHPEPTQSAPSTPNTESKDTKPPTILGVSGVSEGSILTDPARLIFYVAANDDQTKTEDLYIRWQLNSAEWNNWERQTRIYLGPIQDGEYTISFQAKDLAGNISSTKSISFQVKRP